MDMRKTAHRRIAFAGATAVLLAAALLTGCGAGAGGLPETKELALTPIPIADTSWEPENHHSCVICFSGESCLLAAEMGQTAYEGTKLLKVSFGDGETETLAELEDFTGSTVLYDGGKIFDLGRIDDPSERRLAVTDLADGETSLFPFKNGDIFLRMRILPCRSGFVAASEAFSESDPLKKIYRVSSYGAEGETILTESVLDLGEGSGRCFVADAAERDGEELIWLLCGVSESGRQYQTPFIEIYGMDGVLRETRDIAGWEKAAERLEKRYDLPYDAGAVGISVMGGGEYIFVDFQVDSLLFQWKNGSYRCLGSPAEDESNAEHMLFLSSVSPRCTGCEFGSVDGTRLRCFCDIGGEHGTLYIFDPSGGRFYSYALPDDWGRISLDINCGGDLLIRSYRDIDTWTSVLGECYIIPAEDIEEAIARQK